MNTILQKRIEEAAKKMSHNKMSFWEDCDYSTKDIEEIIYDACKLTAVYALQNQWISVEEECPIGTCVLLDKYGNMQLDKFDFRAWGYIQNKEITHWMPIPKLKEE